MSKSINKNYDVGIRIITPLHIGAGSDKDWFPGIHYFLHQDMVYVLNLEKIFDQLPEQAYTKAATFFSKKKSWEQVQAFCQQHQANAETAIEHEFMAVVPPENEIKTHIRTGTGQPYLPGSSIKGAIRSAMFGQLFRANPNLQHFALNKTETLLERDSGRGPHPRDIGKASDEINKKAFGEINTGLMRLLHISDAGFETTELAATKIANRYGYKLKQGWKHKSNQSSEEFKSSGFTSMFETLWIDAESRCRITFATTLFELIEQYQPKKQARYTREFLAQRNPLEYLFGVINEHTRQYIRREIDYHKVEKNPDSDLIIDYLEELLDFIPANHAGCLLRIGAGSGFHSITGDWRYDDHTTTLAEEDRLNYVYSTSARRRTPARYKSRKLAFEPAEDGYDFIPMGFVLLTS